MSQFGGQPVDTGSQFGGTPLVDVSQQANPALAAKLNNLYWTAANAVGHDSPQAKQIFQVMQNAGVHLSSPSDPAVMQRLDANAAQNNVNQQSFGQNVGAAAGYAVKAIPSAIAESALRGGPVGQLTQLLAQKLGAPGLEDQIGYNQVLKPLVDARRARDAEAAPVLRTGGGIVGNVGVHAAPFLLSGGAGALTAPSTYGMAALQGAGLGASTPADSLSQMGANTLFGAAGGVGGQALSKAIPAVISPLRTAANAVVDPAKVALANSAQKLGVPLRLAQLSNNPLVHAMSSFANQMPFSGGGAINAAQKAAVNRIAAKSIGEDANSLTSDVYEAARKRIGDTFNDVTSRNDLQVTPQLTQAVNAIKQEAATMGTQADQAKIDGIIADLSSKMQTTPQGVKVPGEALQKWDTVIGKTTPGDANGYYTRQVRDAVRNAMDASIKNGATPEDAALWAQARRQYANLKTLQPLVAKSADQGISPQGLMGRVTANGYGKEMMARGNGGVLGDLANVSSGLLKNQVNDSGTPLRLLAGEMMSGLGAAALGHPQVAAAAMAPIVPMAIAGRVLNSPMLARAALSRFSPAPSSALINRLSMLGRGLPFASPPSTFPTRQEATP